MNQSQISSPSATTDTTQSAASKPGVSYSETLEKTSSKIKDTKEFEECMRPSVNMCVNQVGNELARAKKSAEFCDAMTEEAARNACKYGVIMAEVTETKNIKLCDTLGDAYKHDCRISTMMGDAIASGDLKKCDGITAEFGSGGQMGVDRAEQCRADLIMRKTDAKNTDCDILKDGPSKDMCKAILRNRTQGVKILQEAPQTNPNAQ